MLNYYAFTQVNSIPSGLPTHFLKSIEHYGSRNVLNCQINSLGQLWIKDIHVYRNKDLFTWSGGPRSSGVGFFCFHALEDTKQKKPTPLDRGPPLHVNKVLVSFVFLGDYSREILSFRTNKYV